MTSTLLIQLGLLVILAVLVGFAIPTIVQIRRTAKAVEDLVQEFRPKLLDATTNLDTLLGRANRSIEGVEEGARSVVSTMSDVRAAISSFMPPMGRSSRVPTALSALVSFLSGAWGALSARKVRAKSASDPAPEPAPTGGSPDTMRPDGGSSHGR